MNRNMTVTMIRGNGDGVDVIVNGFARQEIARQNAACRAEIEHQRAQMRAETERNRTVEASRNRLLAEQLAATRRALYRRPPLGKRIRNRIADAWALAIGTIIAWGEDLGLWVYEGWKD